MRLLCPVFTSVGYELSKLSDLRLAMLLMFPRNYNYGFVGKGIKQDLLNHPELLEQNVTLAFEAAIWRWMTPMKRKQPSAHDVFVGNN